MLPDPTALQSGPAPDPGIPSPDTSFSPPQPDNSPAPVPDLPPTNPLGPPDNDDSSTTPLPRNKLILPLAGLTILLIGAVAGVALVQRQARLESGATDDNNGGNSYECSSGGTRFFSQAEEGKTYHSGDRLAQATFTAGQVRARTGDKGADGLGRLGDPNDDFTLKFDNPVEFISILALDHDHGTWKLVFKNASGEIVRSIDSTTADDEVKIYNLNFPASILSVDSFGDSGDVEFCYKTQVVPPPPPPPPPPRLPALLRLLLRPRLPALLPLPPPARLLLRPRLPPPLRLRSLFINASRLKF
ncbi:hypothetical protein A3C34_03545 [Candidatus Amesbacteria bacterium RIFCSPHIGHO2_02_FULL_48_21]|nr:MAG: hypothetical protein A3C34_03545 [Candidatus Amesbacteria bacterium RIFCSPHIGHO2_02_FULL_48_21]